MKAAALPDWPLAEYSRHVRSRPHEWHLQQMGDGPDLLLLHGTGAATHSWRDLIPLLAAQFRVTAVDLPGHGFTRLGSRMRSSLPAMTDDLAALCRVEGIAPVGIVGHSAGAALGLRLVDAMGVGTQLIGINPALHPFQGLAGLMFPAAARMMAMTPGMVDMLTWNMAQPGRVISLLGGTGSKLSAHGMDLYARLFCNRAHVEGTLLMMAQWKLDGLQADLPRVKTPCLFLTGSNDRMVPPVSAVEAAARMPDATVHSLEGYGHLVHEEAPDTVARLIAGFVRR
ncbi:alpha/beta fold hydrolase BchO [Thetidibacter halocola]|uniref:Alpha/beta fold hydrolase n=1 Tax=Thetidibacter halocola TaxID=2827239 RepID=A0A8J7WBM1_9RHOB|nr:alpha/beta fold hydrolase BchO [Thetidibacter halocola]MBS0123449.1 alpha/beta fold hydrolase [Thetidibacter halocola]